MKRGEKRSPERERARRKVKGEGRMALIVGKRREGECKMRGRSVEVKKKKVEVKELMSWKARRRNRRENGERMERRESEEKVREDKKWPEERDR